MISKKNENQQNINAEKDFREYQDVFVILCVCLEASVSRREIMLMGIIAGNFVAENIYWECGS